MNTELLRRILDDARDKAIAEKRYADDDEIRCLMWELKLNAPTDRMDFYTRGSNKILAAETDAADRKARKGRWA